MNDTEVRISALSYSNTYPFVYGLQKKFGSSNGKMRFEVPAVSARRFAGGEVDVALIPVGALPQMTDYKVITDYCIGSNGKVKTVSLFSQKPLDKIDKIFLDIESLTSVNLVKILAKKHWKISPQWESFDSKSNPVYHDSVVLIGDKTFGMENRYDYEWDLSSEWRDFTGLPFVFAVWIAKPSVEDAVIRKFNDALTFGLKNISRLYDEFLIKIPRKDFEDYLYNYIDFNFDLNKKKAMDLFLKLMRS